MDYVYLIWVDINDWPENGGGTYLDSIYANKEDADRECERLNRNPPSKEVRYYVGKAPVK